MLWEKKLFLGPFFPTYNHFNHHYARGGGVGVEVNYIKNNLRTLFYVIKLR